MVLPGADIHERSGILPPPELTQEFLGAEFFFQYIFTNPRTGELDINHYLDMSSKDLELLNRRMHQEAALHEDAEERHTHISHYWALIGQYFARLASQDGLTGLFNKRAFADVLEKRLQRLAKFDGTEKRESGHDQIALIDVDLNRFKPVNDVFGHGVGDQALIETARLLDSSIRINDTAGRLGGDEFSVLVTGNSSEEVQDVFKRLESNFEQLVIQIPLDQNINVSDKDLAKLDFDKEDERLKQSEWKVTDLSTEEYRKLGLDVRYTDSGNVFLSIDATLGMAVSESGMTADELEAKADKDMYARKTNKGWEHYSR